MKKFGQKKCPSCPPFRRKQLAAKDRKFCITWINRMVTKKVEKQIAELRSEVLLMHHALREEMVAELQQQLRELVVEEAGERSLQYIRLKQEQRLTSWWERKMEKEYEENEDENDEANSLDLETLSFNFSSVTPTDTDRILSLSNTPTYDQGESLKFLFDASSAGDTRDGCNDADNSSQPATCEEEQKQQIPSDSATVADTSQSLKKSEKESSSNPLYVDSSFMTVELKCEKKRVQLERTKEEEALLTVRQWNEWMDEQEMRQNHKVKLVDRQNAEKQAGAAPPVPQKQLTPNVQEEDTVTKIKTYFCDLFNPSTSSKWERLEDED